VESHADISTAMIPITTKDGKTIYYKDWDKGQLLVSNYGSPCVKGIVRQTKRHWEHATKRRYMKSYA
jgi:PKD repeat protein